MTKVVSFRGKSAPSGTIPKVKRASTVIGSELPAIKLNIVAERWRFYAYIAFWSMCILAIALSKIFVAPILAAGPEDGSTCGPFNRDAPEFGVELGQGFDMTTESHLQQIFGYNNICVNWDYSPSRELTAMAYPIFEYSLLIYLVLDFIATTLSNRRGELDLWFWRFCKVIFPINVFLCAQFRMIFVCIAYENVQQHTAGFLGLQMALILVSIQNAGYVWDTDIAYDIGIFGDTVEKKRRGTRIAVVVYIICTVIISIVKVSATANLVLSGEAAPWTMKESFISGAIVGQLVDWIWMVFNAVLPLFISFYRSRHEQPLEITITQDQFYEVDDDDETATATEKTPLSNRVV